MKKSIGAFIVIVLIGVVGYSIFQWYQSNTSSSSSSSSSANVSIPQKKGDAKIERWWEENTGDNCWVYILVSYENTTTSTFNGAVEVIGTIYDKAGNMIDQDDGYFFAHEVGSITPGFTGTVKLMISSTKGRAQKADVRVTKAY